LEGVVKVGEPYLDVGIAIGGLAEEAGDFSPLTRRAVFKEYLPADLSYVDVFLTQLSQQAR
jgi:hypothetical protein